MNTTKSTIEVAPYTATIEKDGWAVSILVKDEHGKQVSRAVFNSVTGNYNSISVTVKKFSLISEVSTVLQTIATQIEEKA